MNTLMFNISNRTMDYDDMSDGANIIVTTSDLSFCLHKPRADYTNFMTTPTQMAGQLSWLVRAIHNTIILEDDTFTTFKNANYEKLQSLREHWKFLSNKVRILKWHFNQVSFVRYFIFRLIIFPPLFFPISNHFPISLQFQKQQSQTSVVESES